jgi:hypothetical protein
MSNQSGITVSSELKDAWVAAGSGSPGFIQVTIKDEKEFWTSGVVASTGDRAKDFEAAQAVLANDPTNACVILIPDGASKWISILFIPLNAKVRSKMIYASSIAGLKEGLEGSAFSGDFHIEKPEECTLKQYEDSIAKGDDDMLMSMDEVDKKRAEFESQMMVSNATMTVNVSMPLKTDQKVLDEMKKLKDGEIHAISMSLDTETEIMRVSQSGTQTIEEVGAAIPDKSARFILFNFKHTSPKDEKEKETLVFIYCSQNSAKPKSKMFYSASKAVCLEIIEKNGLKVENRMETSDPKDFTSAWLMDELYPQVVQKKVFKKPRRPGRGKRTTAKFSAK